MSRDTQNPEGLTFEEWVCAAGLAKQDHTNAFHTNAFPPVRPYSSSDTVYRSPPQPAWAKGTVTLICHGNSMPRGIPVRRSSTYYTKKIRDAWRRGEDPTEWRS
jgi:hypothetical protein